MIVPGGDQIGGEMRSGGEFDPPEENVDIPRRILSGASLVLPDRVLVADLLVEGGSLIGVAPAGQGESRAVWSSPRSRPAEIWDVSGHTILPGLIDMHTHGGWGIDFSRASSEEILGTVEKYASVGVTRFLVTLVPSPLPELEAQLAAAATACQQHRAFLGIHLEGPFLCRDRRGALPEAGIVPYSSETFERLRLAANGFLRVMTFAPEAVPAEEIPRIRAAGVHLSIGHTSADAATTQRAIDAGVERATHLCNAMPPLHHREPGPLLPILRDHRVRAEVIVDGEHVCDEMIDLALQLKGREGIFAVSDSMPLAVAPGETPPVEELEFAGAWVRREEGRAVNTDGVLAGSVTHLLPALERRMRARLSESTDLRSTSLCGLVELGATVPAADLRMTSTGRLARNTCADLVIVRGEPRALVEDAAVSITNNIVATIRRGERADAVDAPFLPDSLRRQ